MSASQHLPTTVLRAASVLAAVFCTAAWPAIGSAATPAATSTGSAAPTATATSTRLTTPTATASPTAGYVHADGLLIKDGAGKELKLKGMNLGGWLLWEGWIFGGGYDSETTLMKRLTDALGAEAAEKFRVDIHANFITEKDIAHIAAMGFNCVRVPVGHHVLDDDAHPGVFKDSGWQTLDRLLGWCEKHKLYVVLDLAAAPGGQSDMFCADPDPKVLLWASEENQARTVAWWKAVAARYKDRRIIAGFDLLDEPVAPDAAKLIALYRRIIAAVREVDPGHMIFIQGHDLTRDLTVFPGPLTVNQAYTFHIYTFWSDDRKKLLAGWAAAARKQNIPLWAGEFGEDKPDMLKGTVAMLEDPASAVTGWCFWTWKKAPNKYPALLSIDLPASWKDVLPWLGGGWFARQPSAAAAGAAAKDFLEAIQHDDNIEYADTVELLGGKK